MVVALARDAGLRPPQPTDFVMKRRRPIPALAGLVVDLCGYLEIAPGHFRQVEAASLVAPLVISFGEAFSIGLGRLPGRQDRQSNFAAGLYAGPVVIDSFGAACCIQVNFTPLGAYRFFGLPMRELADRMVALDDVLGPAATSLRDRLGEELDWERRFDLVEAMISERLFSAPLPTPSIAWAYRRLIETSGAEPVGAIAARLDCSRKHLAERFRIEIGLGPKAIGRIARLNRAMKLARKGCECWAGIAAECGYADQAHLVREFTELAGETPTAWQARPAI